MIHANHGDIDSICNKIQIIYQSGGQWSSLGGEEQQPLLFLKGFEGHIQVHTVVKFISRSYSMFYIVYNKDLQI